MIVRGREFDEIYDLVGIRVLVNSVRDCYAVLGAIHARWNPMPGPVQGLHRDPEVQPLPVAAHHGDRPEGRAGRDPDPHPRDAPARRVRCRGALEVQGAGQRRQGRRPPARRTTPTWRGSRTSPTGRPRPPIPGEFLDSLRFEIGAKEVYVFTPKGKVIGLPAGATPVDFAYAVHTEVGHRTMGAKVNGRLVPLESELSSGDVVEVFTSKNPDSGPSQDWLNFVKSPRARNKIRQWFTKERRDEAIEQGKDAIARAMRKQNLPLQKLMSQDSFAEVAAQMRYDDVSALYAAVGEGHVSTQSVLEKVARRRCRRRRGRRAPTSPIPVRVAAAAAAQRLRRARARAPPTSW